MIRLLSPLCLAMAGLLGLPTLSWASDDIRPQRKPTIIHRSTRALPFSGSNRQPENPLLHVVFVHGFLENGSSWATLRRHMQKMGAHCLTVRLTPNDARHGIESLSQQLHEQIDEALGENRHFSIVAFSMGGLVSRHYLQHLGGADRCQQLITIASPHHGTHTARLYPSKGAAQMVPGSEFLQRLASSEDRLGDMPLTSLRTPLDLVIVPSRHSAWERADNKVYPVLLHPFMINNPFVFKEVERRLLRFAQRPVSSFR